MWKDIEAAPPDAIFGLTEAFKKDESPDKINLGAGVYKNEQGITPIFACVKDAERILLGREQTKSYLPISGDPGYGICVQNLLFGADSEIVTGGRAATAHAPGGTGALRMGAELLKRFRPAATVWLSGPTWANHRAIFSAPGFAINTYPYYDAATRQLAADDLLSCLATIPAGDIVVLHGCCHNPSGVDLDTAQWEQVFAISTERGWLPLIDFAYQGFADGIEPTAAPDDPENPLDRWVLSEAERLVAEVTTQLDGYEMQRAIDPIVSFIDSLNNWYIRRSRRRFWKKRK